MKQCYMVIDVGSCSDCNNCFMGCKDEHVNNDWPGYTGAQPQHGHRWINIKRHERGQYPRIDVAYRPTPCQHCENAPCIKAGAGAVVRRDDGIVLIDTEKAKGNKALVDACPYGAIYWNHTLDVPQKCTLCAHLLDDATWTPAMPRCAHNCSTGAMQFYKREPSDMEAMVKAEGLSNLKPELGTRPHVYYKNLHRIEKNFITAAVLVDGDCFENANVTLEADGENLATQTTTCFGEFKFDALDDGCYSLSIEADGRSLEKMVTIKGQSLNLGYIKL